MLRLLKELIRSGTPREDPEITPEGMVITGQGGLLNGTLVATDEGWRPVETICVGDRLLSFDHGLQEVRELQRERPRSHSGHTGKPRCAVEVPAGALDNDTPLWLMPDQGVLFESDKALEILDARDTWSRAEIRKQYKSLVKDLHPDLNGGNRADEERLQEVVWAWDQIKESRSFRE